MTKMTKTEKPATTHTVRNVVAGVVVGGLATGAAVVAAPIVLPVLGLGALGVGATALVGALPWAGAAVGGWLGYRHEAKK